MRAIEHFAALNGINVLVTGIYIHADYSDISTAPTDPTKQEFKQKIDYRIWFLQVIVWNVVVIIVKITLFFAIHIFKVIFEGIAETILGPLRQYPDLKLILIMIFVPVVLNSIQFWVVDNILKGDKQNVINFVNSPFNDFQNTRKLSAKLPLRPPNKKNGVRNRGYDIEQSLSERHA